MPLIGFGDLAQSNTLRQHTGLAKSAVTRLSNELTTGQPADAARHLAGDLGPVMSLDASLSRLAGFKSVTREMSVMAETMQSGLSKIANLATETASTLLLSTQANAPVQVDAAAKAASSALVSTFSTLNLRIGDRSLFAGTEAGSGALIDASTFLAQLETEIANAGAASVADVETTIDLWLAAPTGFDTVAYLGGPPRTDVPIGADDAASLDVTAKDAAMKETIKGLAMAALIERGLFSGQPLVRRHLAQRAGEVLIAGETGRAEVASRLGATQARIDQADTRNENEATALGIARAGLMEIDPYETATKLQDAENQLNLIYTLTARLSRLSLADYL